MFQSNSGEVLRLALKIGDASLRNCNESLPILQLSSVDNMRRGSLAFAKRTLTEGEIPLADALLITTPEIGCDINMPLLIVENPRLTFAYTANALVARAATIGGVEEHPVSTDAAIHETVTIGHGTAIGRGCRIGPGTRIGHSVTIGCDVFIGQDCIIGSNSVIGETGFGVESFGNFENVRLPHVGGVVIGDNVHIGALNSIAAGTLSPTIIEDHVQTDNCVHIAHNCRIGQGTLITACVEISGSVDVGRGVWIGPNSSIMNGVAIGDRALVGIGTLVRKDCNAGMVYAGTPAKCLGERAP
jgi:UDP-3-O-[3-hydroxymyristoyl] glucosamine N-acyltransferase